MGPGPGQGVWESCDVFLAARPVPDMRILLPAACRWGHLAGNTLTVPIVTPRSTDFSAFLGPDLAGTYPGPLCPVLGGSPGLRTQCLWPFPSLLACGQHFMLWAYGMLTPQPQRETLGEKPGNHHFVLPVVHCDTARQGWWLLWRQEPPPPPPPQPPTTAPSCLGRSRGRTSSAHQ